MVHSAAQKDKKVENMSWETGRTQRGVPARDNKGCFCREMNRALPRIKGLTFVDSGNSKSQTG